jgi:hypothetical protein
MSELIEQLADVLAPVSEKGDRSDASLLPNKLPHSYRYFLSICDGGYTRDRFLHFFGLRGDPRHNVIEWNNVDKWKRYFSLDENSFVFAENLFGSQFFFDIRGNRKVVKMLLPSTGQATLYTDSFDDFVGEEGLSVTFSHDTRSLAQEFFSKKSLEATPFTHISCKRPVLLGGSELDLGNLEIADSLTNLVITGQIVDHVKKMPMGTRIDSIRVEES